MGDGQKQMIKRIWDKSKIYVFAVVMFTGGIGWTIAVNNYIDILGK